MAAAPRSCEHSVASPTALKGFQTHTVKPLLAFANAAILSLGPRAYYHLSTGHKRSLITPAARGDGNVHSQGQRDERDIDDQLR